MSWKLVERIANAVLYEGYILYPYRASSVKNQRRFNFGVLVPPAYSAVAVRHRVVHHAHRVPGRGGPQTSLDVRVRFLQVCRDRAGIVAECGGAGSAPHGCACWATWRPRAAREFLFSGGDPGKLHRRRRDRDGPAPGRGVVPGGGACGELDASRVIRNSSAATRYCLIRWRRAHHSGGAGWRVRFAARSAGALAGRGFRCRNVGTWPVLAGEPGQRGCMLSSPIILYDYPQIARGESRRPVRRNRDRRDTDTAHHDPYGRREGGDSRRRRARPPHPGPNRDAARGAVDEAARRAARITPGGGSQ
jgi:hypothetical protein